MLRSDVGDVKVGTSTMAELRIDNTGNRELTITSIAPGDPNLSDFAFIDDCNIVPVRTPCLVTITFSPTTTGSKTATLTIVSDDIDESPLVVTLTGTSSIDADGIPDAEENGGPNGGDGDNNGVLDSTEENVATFRSIKGSYVTLIAETAGTTLERVKAVSNPTPIFTPTGFNADINFLQGYFRFEISGVPSDGKAVVTMILPPGNEPSDYFMFTRILINNIIIPSWILYNFNGNTSTGAEINGNVITLHFVDGEIGDADLQVNGRIADPGGPVSITPIPVVTNTESASSGCSLNANNTRSDRAGDWWLVFIFLSWLSLFRRHYRTRSPE